MKVSLEDFSVLPPRSSPRFLFLLYVIIGFLSRTFWRVGDMCNMFQYIRQGSIVNYRHWDAILHFFFLVKSSCFIFHILHFIYLFISQILGGPSFFELFCNDVTLWNTVFIIKSKNALAFLNHLSISALWWLEVIVVWALCVIVQSHHFGLTSSFIFF